jgi:hypothetical protein
VEPLARELPLAAHGSYRAPEMGCDFLSCQALEDFHFDDLATE